MAGKFKGLALMGAVALHLSSTSAQAADPPSQEQAPPATSPQSVLQLSQADLEQLEKLGISTSQAEVDAELEEMQQNPEVYGPVDHAPFSAQLTKTCNKPSANVMPILLKLIKRIWKNYATAMTDTVKITAKYILF